jgi:hypothetical protein
LPILAVYFNPLALTVSLPMQTYPYSGHFGKNLWTHLLNKEHAWYERLVWCSLPCYTRLISNHMCTHFRIKVVPL